jgi:hypothetical protein
LIWSIVGEGSPAFSMKILWASTARTFRGSGALRRILRVLPDGR